VSLLLKVDDERSPVATAMRFKVRALARGETALKPGDFA
jgi:hypothetical protein